MAETDILSLMADVSLLMDARVRPVLTDAS